MKKRILSIALLLAALLLALWLTPRGPRIPARFISSLPETCTQVVLVLLPDEHSVAGRLWMMEQERGTWRTVGEPITCTIGHNGLAWGDGEHTSTAPVGFRVKREGDKCSPAGVFRLPTAFGMAASVPELKMPYIALTPSIIGVDDPKSRYYNQIVDGTKVERDWDSNEAMLRHDRLYELGAFIDHNPRHIPGGGSCIFLHVWPGPGKGTAGCTAMSFVDLKRLLAWIDPAKTPRLVQGVEAWQ